MELVLATNNPHKKTEISAILQHHTILLPNELGVQFDHDETGVTYFENAFSKAKTLYDLVKKPVLADDSGLVVPSLDGEPGIYSSRYGSDEAGRMLEQKERNAYLLEKMMDITDRRAYFVCCMVLILEDERYFACQETVHGRITLKPAGTGGFGYDPLFFLDDFNKTVAELPEDEKNRISHRGLAGKRMESIIAGIEREKDE